MAEYLYNTLFTNYAFHKLAVDLANDGSVTYPYSPYNLIIVKVGDGDNSANLDKLALSKSLYTLNITDVKTSSSGTITFTCEIPEDLEDVEITEIGLFDVVNGEEKLFSYSRVELIKPADLGFKLSIEMNLTLRTVNFFPNTIKLIIHEYELAKKATADGLERAFLYLEANLERIIDYNAWEIGKRKAQVIYEEGLKINNSIYGFAYADRYFNLLNKFGDNVRNVIYIKPENYLSYFMNDMATDVAYAEIYSNKVTVYGDLVNFNSAATLSFEAKLGDFLEEEIPIINKVERLAGGSLREYFRFRIINGNTLHFSITETDGFHYVLSKAELTYLKDNYTNYTITFNGVIEHPIFHLYIDGVEKEIEQNFIDLIKIEDYSDIPLRNYTFSSDNVDSYPAYNSASIYNTGDKASKDNKFYVCKYDNVTGDWDVTKWEEHELNEVIIDPYIETKSVVFIDTEIEADDAYLMYITQKQRNTES